MSEIGITLHDEYTLDSESCIVRLVHAQPDATGRATNCYVVISHHAALVIDPGASDGAFMCTLNDVLRAHDVWIKNVSYAVTHIHTDHAGFICACVPKESRVYAFEKSKHFLLMYMSGAYEELNRKRFVCEGCRPHEVEVLTRQHMSYITPLDVNRITWLQEYDVIDVGNIHLSVINTSGHTPGCASLYDAQHHAIFTGDFLLAKPTPITMCMYSRCVLQQYFDSLERVEHLKRDVTVYPAHGDMAWKLGDALDREYAIRHKRIIWILEMLGRRATGFKAIDDDMVVQASGDMRGKSAAELMKHVSLTASKRVHGDGESLRLGSFMNLLAYLEYLTDKGWVARNTVDGCVRYCITDAGESILNHENLV